MDYPSAKWYSILLTTGKPQGLTHLQLGQHPVQQSQLPGGSYHLLQRLLLGFIGVGLHVRQQVGVVADLAVEGRETRGSFPSPAIKSRIQTL